jgi:hypothetical protein
MYVANRGRVGSEFVSCITPEHSLSLTADERKKCKVWSAWDNAAALLKEGKS